jgi:uncharacterized protein YaiI (UPF0178 family)
MTENSPNHLSIWIDADACPTAIKDLVFRASKRLSIKVTLVANQSIRVPDSKLITAITVRDGADIADNEIVKMMKENDIVITGDIPLAARVVEKGGIAIGTRGELYDEGSIQSRLATRNLMEQFRAAGMETSGPKPLNQKDIQEFANQLDRLLTKSLRNRKPE